jgi:hypothetical protein
MTNKQAADLNPLFYLASTSTIDTRLAFMSQKHAFQRTRQPRPAHPPEAEYGTTHGDSFRQPSRVHAREFLKGLHARARRGRQCFCYNLLTRLPSAFAMTFTRRERQEKGLFFLPAAPEGYLPPTNCDATQ